jgi:hypothetical protein
VTHPYRRKPALGPYRDKPDETPVERAAVARLDVSTMAFGLCCGIVGQALAGPGGALGITLVGVILLLASGRR